MRAGWIERSEHLSMRGGPSRWSSFLREKDDDFSHWDLWQWLTKRRLPQRVARLVSKL
jgi:hypothetical protein